MKRHLHTGPLLTCGLLCLYLLLTTGNLKAQSEEDKYQFHPVFIYNFIKYSQWPSSSPGGPIVIGILGESPILAGLAKMAQGRMINDRKIVVRAFKDASLIRGCHVLFVPKNYRDNFSFLLSALSGSATLIITEKEGMGKAGAGINFVYKEDKLKYQINTGALKQQGIQVSTEISKLAIPL